jgi:hypothetical protein
MKGLEPSTFRVAPSPKWASRTTSSCGPDRMASPTAMRSGETMAGRSSDASGPPGSSVTGTVAGRAAGVAHGTVRSTSELRTLPRSRRSSEWGRGRGARGARAAGGRASRHGPRARSRMAGVAARGQAGQARDSARLRDAAPRARNAVPARHARQRGPALRCVWRQADIELAFAPMPVMSRRRACRPVRS